MVLVVDFGSPGSFLFRACLLCSCSQTVAGARVIWTSAGAVGWNTSIWALRVAWASSQHGDWISRANVSTELNERYVIFYELVSQVTWHPFFHMMLDKGVIKVHSGSRGKTPDPTSQ